MSKFVRHDKQIDNMEDGDSIDGGFDLDGERAERQCQYFRRS